MAIASDIIFTIIFIIYFKVLEQVTRQKTGFEEKGKTQLPIGFSKS